MRKLLLSLLRDRAAIYLVALPIIKVAGRKKNSPPVSTLAVCCPDIVDTEKCVTIARFCGPIDKDCATVSWLAWLVLW